MSDVSEKSNSLYPSLQTHRQDKSGKVCPRFPFRAEARRRWPGAEWIYGEGPFALLAHCEILTITLHDTRAKAEEAKRAIDETFCGHTCNKQHEIVEICFSAPGENA
jgi:hypothetical protein